MDTQKTSYKQLVDPDFKWYKSRRIIILNLWIFLLYVHLTFLKKTFHNFTCSLISMYRLVTSTANGYDGSMMSRSSNMVALESTN